MNINTEQELKDYLKGNDDFINKQIVPILNAAVKAGDKETIDRCKAIVLEIKNMNDYVRLKYYDKILDSQG